MSRTSQPKPVKTSVPRSDAPSGTTSLTYQYNRQGLPKQVADATGTRTLDYCTCGKLSQETYASGFYGSRVLTYNFEQSVSSVLGRTKGYTLTLNGVNEQIKLTH